MSFKSNLTASAVVACAFTLAACSSTPGTPDYDAAGYNAIEKNGRIYLFVPGSGAEQAFKRTGEMAKSVTYIGKGPNGMTIVADPEVDVSKYIAATSKK